MESRFANALGMTIIAAVAAPAVASALLLSGCALPSQTPSPNNEREGIAIVRDREVAPAGEMIDAEAAARAALEHADLAEQDVTGLLVELNSEGDATMYEVEFHVGATEYDYDIDSATGAVLGFEVGADG